MFQAEEPATERQISRPDVEIRGAVYLIRSGEVEWLE